MMPGEPVVIPPPFWLYRHQKGGPVSRSLISQLVFRCRALLLTTSTTFLCSRVKRSPLNAFGRVIGMDFLPYQSDLRTSQRNRRMGSGSILVQRRRRIRQPASPERVFEKFMRLSADSALTGSRRCRASSPKSAPRIRSLCSIDGCVRAM